MRDGRSARKLEIALGICLFAATSLVYSSVVHHDFVNFDDLHLVVNNPNLARPATFSNLLSHFYVPVGSNLLPLYWISLQLGFAAHGPNPAAFLLTNVLIHATSTVVLFVALRRLTGAVGCSAFVAAVFGVHPLHVESVGWVVERKDVLAGLFWMLGLYSYSHYTKAPRSKLRYLAVLLCLTLGLMSKSTLVTFPAVLLLLDVWPLDRLRGATGRVLLEKVPMFVLVAIAATVTVLTQRDAGNLVAGLRMGFGSRLANGVESYWSYLQAALWPQGLAAFYPHPYLFVPVSGEAAVAAAGWGIALVASTALILWASRQRPYLGVGWLWFLGTLVPMIGLVQVGFQARADRYTYLPLVGLSIMLAWGVADLLPAKRRRLGAVLAGVVLVGLAVTTRLQLRHWEDTLALFARAVAVTEGNFYAHERLAHHLLEVGRAEEARDQYRAAIAIVPWYAPYHYSLGLAQEGAGDRDAAIVSYRRALKLQPVLPVARGALGLLLLEDGRLVEAERHLRTATRAMPESTEYREALEDVRRRRESPEADAAPH